MSENGVKLSNRAQREKEEESHIADIYMYIDKLCKVARGRR